MKGIISKPMPKHWYDAKAAAATGDPIDPCICVDKKPYFMIYRYPELRSKHLAFSKSANMKSWYRFGADLNTVISDSVDGSEDFVHWHDKMEVVQSSHGTINRICKVCEDYFDALRTSDKSEPFDYSILKTGVDYSRRTKDQIKILYQDYMLKLQSIATAATEDEVLEEHQILRDEFKRECALVCPSEIELCDIIVDLCYCKEKSKQFAWDMCGDQMLINVLRTAGGVIHWPKATIRGDVVYGGRRFKLETMQLTEVNDDERYCYERSV